MSAKASSILSVALVVLILLILGSFVFLMNVLMLNGFGREGGVALTVTGVCSGIGVILAAVLAGKLTKFFIVKQGWNPILAMFGAVAAAVLCGAALEGIAFFISLGVVEALFYN
ncbi:MAG: hypothetical protein IT310_07140 [Anaerolineales bacterium]|nr:hypothetical protein [Anaerolineales bacterium]